MEQPVPANAKTYQMVKNNDAMKQPYQLMGKTTASNKMAGLNSNMTILTLNINGLNAPIKRHRLANWIKSQELLVCHIQEAHLTYKDSHRFKIKGWKKIYQADREQKKVGVAI